MSNNIIKGSSCVGLNDKQLENTISICKQYQRKTYSHYKVPGENIMPLQDGNNVT